MRHECIKGTGAEGIDSMDVPRTTLERSRNTDQGDGIDIFYGLSENATHGRSRITGAGAGIEAFYRLSKNGT